MSPVTATGSQSVPNELNQKGRTLTKEELEAGVKVMKGLQTVERALRREDLNDPKLVEMVSQNIVANDRHNDSFVRYIRQIAGYEYADWVPVVEQVVAEVVTRHQATQKRQGRKTSRASLLAHAG